MDQAPFQLPPSWTDPSDPAAAERLVERFTALSEAEARLAAQPNFLRLLRAIGGNSPFLSDLAVRDSAVLCAFAAQGPDAVLAEAVAGLGAIPAGSARTRVAASLRAAKRTAALCVALADLGRIWKLGRVTQALSDFAEAALRLAVGHLLRAAHDKRELRLPKPDEPATGSGFVVLGMGKLGARELNYSSDIDLILLYDPAAGVYTGDELDMGAFYTRLARGLVALMEARDAEGYVFRTDLRLRPDPGATPPAVALPAAITYYESMGQNWERAAMIKARPVAGDLALGADFLEAIRPFVWRRGLDFAAIADIDAMKRRIDAHKRAALDDSGDPAERILGYDVKLGTGGIREIEFLAQTLQLVWGGRDPGLRAPTTLGALAALVRAGRLGRRAAGELGVAYRFLRRIEHRLQMVSDRQTHHLPDRPAGMARIATFLGFANAEEFAGRLLRYLGLVRGRYDELFEPVQASSGEPGILDFRGDEVPEATHASLRSMGFSATREIVDAVQCWQAGRIRAMRSERARNLLQQMLPQIFSAFARQPQPDAAFARFDSFLAHLPAGVPIFSFFQHNPELIQRMAAVLGAAPSLSEYLARHPAALAGLLSPEEAGDPARLLQTRLEHVRGLEDAIITIRRTVHEEDFGLAAATMEGRLDADEAGLRRATLADAAIGALLPRVLEDFSTRYGRVPGGEMAVVALGKAGGREMMAGSDLDLMLVYDHPAEVMESEGARVLPASQWFVRAAHAFIAALTAPGAEGPTYAVDMRLRPSGNKGPVAVSLTSFRRYHAHDAWTWERMALTRARVVAGLPGLCARMEAAIREAIVAAGEPQRIQTDAAAMRARVERDLPPHSYWDVKLRAGGQMEVEFIAQTLQLVHARDDARICSPTTRIALARLAEAGFLSAEDFALLTRADRLWRTVQGMLRLMVGRRLLDNVPEASASALLYAVRQAGTEVDTIEALRPALDEMAGEVRAAFIRLVGEVRL
ncbi:MAG: bifunctional [glutamine synthetase] adenylyltransferase/[glutamine synthetase]-adenylyl-L-tyrosine phosphorylase [Acetobacteraceae bacterium]|nr:bifunctional [glutamine synthetase] adenylyltransferase/[glutamine synthetase]-adenylyl-L-tyrosine phosphorylase [Acetobacteraceae bacterium]